MNELSHPPLVKVTVPVSDYRFSEHAMEVLVEVKRRMQEKNKQFPLPGGAKHASIVISKDTAEAELIKVMCTTAPELNFAPEKVGLINSGIMNDSKKRKEEVETIKSGRYELVIFVNMLFAGFDYPPFSIAGIVTPIRSPVNFAHFAGMIRRVMRKDSETEVGETQIGDIITHKYFEQRKLFDDYKESRIPKEEDKDIDEDKAECTGPPAKV